MATSGTIGQTSITTARLIEKAYRRCGLNPNTLTAETLDLARENLFLLIMSLSNRALNLWCVDMQIIPLVASQATYVLPPGTIDVLNLTLRTPRGDGTYSEIPITPLNRDDYANQPIKSQQSAIPVNYFFEKLIDPQITLWPVPNDATKDLRLYRYRQVQDVGDLNANLEIPTRWMEAIIWQLALRLTFELPGISPERLTAVQAMCQQITLDADGNETDNAPTYLAPNIRGYTR